MKQLIYLLVPAMILASCGGDNKNGTDLATLKKERAELDEKIKKIEGSKPVDSAAVKITPVSVKEMQPQDFNAFVEVQSQISGDENILATSQAPGIVKTIAVRPGQRVSRGQVLATLEVVGIQQQIEALSAQIALAKSVYERQQKLWSQNIGTEVQLMKAKTDYEAAQQQLAGLKSQRDAYRVVAPISGTVDAVNLKVGEPSSPGMNGIRIVSYDKLKAEANLGENYLGKVKQGDKVWLIFPDTRDTLKTSLAYVGQAVDPVSRAFKVEVRLASSSKLHPNMSCILKIANYENRSALVIPVSVIQKTSQGEMVYIADGTKAKAVMITTGRNSNGQVEVLSGLKPGDKVVVAGFEDLDNGETISIQ